MSQTQTTDNTTLNTDLLDKCAKFLNRYYKEDIKHLAQHYPRDQTSLEVNWYDIYRFDPDLAEDLIEHPGTIIPHLRDAIVEVPCPIDTNFEEASVQVTNINEDDSFDVGGYRSNDIGKYVGIYGQVGKITDVLPEPITLVYDCQRCGGTTTVPQDGDELQEPYQCESCERQGPFKVLKEQSDWRDRQVVRVQEPPEQTSGGQSSSVDITLHDDLVGTIEPGDRVNIAGELSVKEPDKGRAFTPHLNGNGIEVEQTDYTEIDIREHREEILEFANGEHGDPYELLVGSIAPKHRGDNHMKKAVALQMFGGVQVTYPDGSRDRGDSHILLLGDPGTGKSTLLQAVEEIAPRSTYASGKGASAAGLTAAAVPDDFGDSKWSLEAGALVQADKGIACIDEIDKVDESAVSSLHDALESQRVTINKASFSNVHLNARTAVLAAGNPKYGRFDEAEPIPDQIEMSPTLLSRFDLIFTVEDAPDDERDREVVDHMVSGRRAAIDAMNGNASDEALEAIQPAVDPELLRAWVAMAKQEVEPRIVDDKVQEHLRDYFTEIRSMGGDGHAIPITFRQLEAIERLAEASARVRLSDVVEIQDVKRAVQLVSRSMKDVGMDPSSGEMDVDIIETGVSMTQKERIHLAQEAISFLQDDGDTQYAPEDDVISFMVEEGATRDNAKHAIDKLKTKGEAYQTEQGLRLTQ